MDNLTVFSLFDGISCGQLALQRAGINVKKYYASEISDVAIRIAKKNFPDTIEVGDVRFLNPEDFRDADVIFGGSPCQSFSFAGSMAGMATKGINKIEIVSLEQYMDYKAKNFEFEGYSYLFWEYVRLVKAIKPKYFLLENVKMAQKWKDVISYALGVEPVLINSDLVSAQSRERLYWTNIPFRGLPEDKHIYIDDIVQTDIEHKFLPTSRLDYQNYDKNKVDKSVHKYTATQIGNSRRFGNAVRSNGKAFTLRRIAPNGVIDPDYMIREFTPIEVERLQTLPDDYTLVENIKNKERYEVCGNGWTVDILAHIFGGLKNI